MNFVKYDLGNFEFICCYFFMYVFHAVSFQNLQSEERVHDSPVLSDFATKYGEFVLTTFFLLVLLFFYMNFSTENHYFWQSICGLPRFRS